ncbi:type VI secretion system contractile sheath small subunit [Enhygromyxa salina]|uniref:Uncharacterized protein n=1 Tax=Enhygromyxa salina TaxID=215803 RepID=A0A2S9YUF1_9BACT|nr:type VI secretion system contractile sheath small subunit [Enhygromyxa salina]PRQ08669.1 hypothetical protein ENSA7_16140 [Enhygromyxa salina]
MSKPVPRSRLNITYRTKIDGKPKKAKLPMRFLVLGDFTNHDRSLLGQRRVHSILPGMKLGSFMEELKISAPIDEPSLQETLRGALTGQITGKFTSQPAEDATEGRLKISGIGVVEGKLSDNGLGSFAGAVELSGEIVLPVDNMKVALPEDAPTEVTVTLFGKVEPPPGAEIGVTGNVEAKVKVQIHANALEDEDTMIDLRSDVVGAGVPVAVTIPIRSINDFKPANIAASVPEIRRLVLLHRLVLEARNYISSFPELREVVKAELAETKAAVSNKDAPVAGADTRLGMLRSELQALYPQLNIEPSANQPVREEDVAE